MKKIILLFVAIGFIAIAAITTTFSANAAATYGLTDSKYKACIDACNACVTSCKKVESMCSKEKDVKMAECGKLCKKCVTSCTEAVKLMQSNDPNCKSKCLECAKICEKCATECDKFDMADCKKCATDCRTAAKSCREM
jgi:hypothetical protein